MWPVDEMGRNSVTPSITARIKTSIQVDTAPIDEKTAFKTSGNGKISPPLLEDSTGLF
jgi:hypothetical protein